MGGTMGIVEDKDGNVGDIVNVHSDHNGDIEIRMGPGNPQGDINGDKNSNIESLGLAEVVLEPARRYWPKTWLALSNCGRYSRFCWFIPSSRVCRLRPLSV